MDEIKLKSITIGFRVPASLDTPSETLARMKAKLLEALAFYAENFNQGDDDDIVDALLTES